MWNSTDIFFAWKDLVLDTCPNKEFNKSVFSSGFSYSLQMNYITSTLEVYHKSIYCLRIGDNYFLFTTYTPRSMMCVWNLCTGIGLILPKISWTKPW